VYPESTGWAAADSFGSIGRTVTPLLFRAAAHGRFPFGSDATTLPLIHNSRLPSCADAISTDCLPFRWSCDLSSLPATAYSMTTGFVPSLRTRNRSPHSYPKASCAVWLEPCARSGAWTAVARASAPSEIKPVFVMVLLLD
jgi:hypothetical protein